MSLIHDENQSPSITSRKCKPMSPFVAKLRLLLQQQKYNNAIRWSPDGRSLIISDIETFKDQVLETDDEMFKTKNFASFVRQLNLYGFRKLQTNNTKGDPTIDMHFEHPNFRRDRPDLVRLVQRTCSSAKKRALIRSLHDTYSPKRLRFENDGSLGMSPLTERHNNEMATPLSDEKPMSKAFYTNENNLQKFLPQIDTIHKVKPIFFNQFFKQAQEHDYALPMYDSLNYEPLDERRMFEFLDNHFNDEVTVVQALLSLSSQN